MSATKLKRTTTGLEPQRLAMLYAVLGARAGVDLTGADVFVNIAGILRLSEPAADLGMLMALASADSNVSPRHWVVVGEVGLSGEVRAASQLKACLAEAAALGFHRAIIPEVDQRRRQGKAALPLVGVPGVGDALAFGDLLPYRTE